MQLSLPDNSAWTLRDLQILEALTVKVRMLTIEQIAETWWPPGRYQVTNARRRMVRLVRAKLVLRYRINIHPRIPLNAPVAEWKPGDDSPEFAAVSTMLKNRWTLPAEPTSVFLASKRSANLFGTYAGPLKDPVQATHDVHLSDIYLWYQQHKPWFCDSWIGEDALKKAGTGVKDPDAFLVRPDGEVSRVIDFGGKYSADRVKEFHGHCAARSLPYELW